MSNLLLRGRTESRPLSDYMIPPSLNDKNLDVLQVSSALYEQKNIRKFAIRVMRNLLVKHEFDDRYASEVRNSSIY